MQEYAGLKANRLRASSRIRIGTGARLVFEDRLVPAIGRCSSDGGNASCAWTCGRGAR